MKSFISIVTIILSIFSGITLNNYKAADFVEHDEIGTMNIAIDAIDMNKEDCINAAEAIRDNDEIVGMTVNGIAKELYAHIAIHNIIENLPEGIKSLSIVSRINSSTINGIDLEDYGDTYLRRIAYDIIWVAA